MTSRLRDLWIGGMAACLLAGLSGCGTERPDSMAVPKESRSGRVRLGIQNPYVPPPAAGAEASAPPPRGRAPAPSSGAPGTTYNPNMYVASTYQGGHGEKDRIEKLINDGVVVHGKRVRLGTFTRNYGQAFPIPRSTALGLVTGTERSKIVREGGRTFLQVGIQAMKGEASRRPPLNVCLVLDRSGSMADEGKMEAAKAAARSLTERLDPDGIFSLVAFDTKAERLIPAGPVGTRARALQAIDRLTPGDATNIYDALALGYQEVRRGFNPDRASRC